MIPNYLSLWIANFGVVPWFSFAFFLLRPAFLALIFLLVRVCVVFDAILKPFKYLINCRLVKITALLLIVKVFVASESLLAQSDIRTYFLAKGQQSNISLSRISKYSIGNKEIVSVKLIRGRTLLVKAKKMGFTDIFVWSKKHRYQLHIYVISKREQLKKAKFAQTLKSIGLSIQTKGNSFYIDGTLEQIKDYRIYKKLLKENALQNYSSVILSKKLRNLIIAQVYRLSYQLGASFIDCFFKQANIFCHIEGVESDNRTFSRMLNSYYIERFDKAQHRKSQNYKLEFRFIKVNHSQESIRSFGTDQISRSVSSILNSANVFSLNTFQLKDIGIKANVIAQPKLTVTMGQNSSVRLGGEFPVIQNQDGRQISSWKFYGLKVSGTLHSHLGKLALSFSNSLTSPFQQNVTGSQGSSRVFVKLDQYIKLFEIDYLQERTTKSQLPLLKYIPLLKFLFSSKNDSESYKHIICFIKITEL